MGRLLKRVPLDFDYPLGKVWKGYLNPYYIECDQQCEGGYSKEYLLLKNYFYHYPLSDQDKKNEVFLLLQPFLTPEVIEERKGHLGHNVYGLLSDLGKEMELNSNWMTCFVCDGHGVHPDYLQKYEDWEQEEPPVGEGYQLWENTSEGSPKSPVFSTLDELCQWCEKHATTFGSMTATKEEWEQILN